MSVRNKKRYTNPTTVLACLWLGAVLSFFTACGTGSTSQGFVCSSDQQCLSTHDCVERKCTLTDQDQDGWSRNKDCNDQKRTVYPGAAEVCGNQIDDNCNGTIDEGSCSCGEGETRECGTDRGLCEKGKQTCKNGTWSLCQGLKGPAKEVCDSKDNDCDGQIDEAVPNCCEDGATQSCGNYRGECVGGTQTCSERKWSVCSAAKITAKDERCDGKDNDCDGKIDNVKNRVNALERICYTALEVTRKKGICRDGKQFCSHGKWGNCVQEVTPKAETCNGRDDDCDGKSDNVRGETQPLTRDCYEGSDRSEGKGSCKKGQQSCRGGRWSACVGQKTPTKESCNGQDDDCDGQVDNKANSREPLQQTCYTGPNGTQRRGECLDGIKVCQQGRWSACTQVKLPQAEVCDGKDNDCDGRIDNKSGSFGLLQKACYTGTKETRKKGDCRDGVQTCVQGKWSACANEIKPRLEACDNRDNDCDGLVDEAIKRVCYTGPGGTHLVGTCKSGSQVCSSGRWSSCQGDVKPTKEICNKKDDDCDGQVDEKDSLPGSVCP